MAFVKKVINKILKLMSSNYRTYCESQRFVPPGHFYSAIPSDSNYAAIYDANGAVRNTTSPGGIDFNEHGQIALLKQIARYNDTLPDFPDNKVEGCRFSYRNPYYSYSDVPIFHGIVNHVRPKHIVDVGGGITTTMMLELNERCFSDDPIRLTVIEPFSERAEPFLAGETTVNKIYSPIQEVDLGFFTGLEPGDILFLDTTHVSKLGSEVDYILFNILPVLRPGVIVHVHDIHYPFEYPAEYYRDGKFWNEIYLWRSFLMHNNAYEILFFNSWFEKTNRDILQELIPKYFNRSSEGFNVSQEGSSLWLLKR